MYQIGLFSKINRITTKTLRYYEQIGLLKPIYVDDFTGYRYYSSSQLPKLHKIIALKQIGLSLVDIKQIIDNEESVQAHLDNMENELKQSIQNEQAKLLLVKNYIKRVRGGKIMNYNPVIKSLPECIVASMRTKVESYDTYFDIVPKMGEKMREAGAVCAVPEYCFIIYHDGEYREKDIDVEICEAVCEPCEDSNQLKFKKISKVNKALCVLHKGPYSTIREAYGFAYQWMKDNEYQAIGMPRESYIDGIWNKENENVWLTELQIPVNK